MIFVTKRLRKVNDKPWKISSKKTKAEEIRGYLNKYQVRRGIAAGVIAAILITVLLLIIFSGGDKKPSSVFFWERYNLIFFSSAVNSEYS